MTTTWIRFEDRFPKKEDFNDPNLSLLIRAPNGLIHSYTYNMMVNPKKPFNGHHWMFFTPPLLPPEPLKDAFDEWRGRKLDAEGSVTMRETWVESAAHALKTERARLAEKVDRLLIVFENRNRSNWTDFKTDLRKIASGENVF